MKSEQFRGNRHCSFCGDSEENRALDEHHVAGILLDPMEVVTACRTGCHRILTGWQWADRVPLDKTKDEPPDDIKTQYMILAVARCLELVQYHDNSMGMAATIQALARGHMTNLSVAVKVRTWEDRNFPRVKSLNPANTPRPSLSPENIKHVLSAMAGIEAWLYERLHGFNHPVAVLLRNFEYDYNLTCEAFGKFSNEIAGLNYKGMLDNSKVQKSLANKINRTVQAERMCSVSD
jgi:hypothetical protein